MEFHKDSLKIDAEKVADEICAAIKDQIKNKLLNHCWRLWSGSVITWDGKVVPCCFDKDASHEMGNLRERSFKGIWNGTSYSHFRQAILRSRKEIDICKNCTEGTKIWA